MPKIKVLMDRCKGCERCNDACPQNIVKMSPNLSPKGYHYAVIADPFRCIGCRMCAISCPDSAIEVYVKSVQYDFFNY